MALAPPLQRQPGSFFLELCDLLPQLGPLPLPRQSPGVEELSLRLEEFGELRLRKPGLQLGLEVECVEAQMRDIGPRWRVKSRPSHDLGPDGSAEPA